MGRSILDITLHLPNGQSLAGRGRNLQATVGRIYNRAFPEQPHHHVVLVEPMRRGHATAQEHRYTGTFHARLLDRHGAAVERGGIIVVDVKEPATPGKKAATAPA